MIKIGRKDAVRKWAAHCREYYTAEIMFSSRYASFYRDKSPAQTTDKWHRHYESEIVLQGVSAEDAIYMENIKNRGANICVLNFASYQDPIETLLDGSTTQEESLCMKSTLYPVLLDNQPFYSQNRRSLNKGLYSDAAIYIPSVVFEWPGNVVFPVDVLSCAAPDAVLSSQSGVSSQELERVIGRRVKFIFDIVDIYRPDVFIIGAWGGGVSKNNPTVVSRLFLDEIARGVCKRVVFAIPEDSYDNYVSFEYNISSYYR